MQQNISVGLHLTSNSPSNMRVQATKGDMLGRKHKASTDRPVSLVFYQR